MTPLQEIRYLPSRRTEASSSLVVKFPSSTCLLFNLQGFEVDAKNKEGGCQSKIEEYEVDCDKLIVLIEEEYN